MPSESSRNDENDNRNIISETGAVEVDTSESSCSFDLPAFVWDASYQPRVFCDRYHDFGKIMIPFTDEEGNTPKPIDVFMAVKNFSELFDNIIIPESIRYAEQKGIAFQVEKEEMKE